MGSTDAVKLEITTLAQKENKQTSLKNLDINDKMGGCWQMWTSFTVGQVPMRLTFDTSDFLE